MDRRTLLTTLAGSASIGTIGTASAQESNSTTSTPTTSNEPITQISDDVALLSWEEQDVDARDKTAIAIDLDADLASSITLTDPFSAIVEQGVTRLDSGRVEVVEAGRNRFVESVTTVRGVGVLGVEVGDEGAIAISTESIRSSGQSRSTSLGEGVAIGASTGILGTGIAAWRHTRDDLDEPEPMDDDDRGGML